MYRGDDEQFLFDMLFVCLCLVFGWFSPPIFHSSLTRLSAFLSLAPARKVMQANRTVSLKDWTCVYLCVAASDCFIAIFDDACEKLVQVCRTIGWYCFPTSAHHSTANDMAEYGVLMLMEVKVNQSTKLMQWKTFQYTYATNILHNCFEVAARHWRTCLRRIIYFLDSNRQKVTKDKIRIFQNSTKMKELRSDLNPTSSRWGLSAKKVKVVPKLNNPYLTQFEATQRIRYMLKKRWVN